MFSEKYIETHCRTIDVFRNRGCINGRFLNDILSKINEIFVSSGIEYNLCDITRLSLINQFSYSDRILILLIEVNLNFKINFDKCNMKLV